MSRLYGIVQTDGSIPVDWVENKSTSNESSREVARE
jgi:hypothetical protein